MEKLKDFFTWRLALSLVLGSTAGYAYYYFIGCSSGSCAISSSPVNSTVYGALLGVLIGMNNKKKDASEDPEVAAKND